MSDKKYTYFVSYNAKTEDYNDYYGVMYDFKLSEKIIASNIREVVNIIRKHLEQTVNVHNVVINNFILLDDE